MRLLDSYCRKDGFTLVEMIVVVIVAGILISVAMKTMSGLGDTAKVESTKQELQALAFGIAGNPDITTNGARSDFGYVGDVGALPANLDALYANPGGYATWKGPYISNRFTQTSDDYKRDAWGNLYSYSGGVSITSSSGGTIIRQIAANAGELLRNTITGTITDIDGTPPGTTYMDSITILLSFPNGSGGTATKSRTPDRGGYFSIDSVPIGLRDLRVMYLPTSDTLTRVVAIALNSKNSVAVRFGEDLWNAPISGGGSIQFVSNSDSLSGNRCQDVSFWLTNPGGSPVTITSISAQWTSPSAFYKTIKWGATTVFNLGGSPRGVSGTTYTLSSPMTLNAGSSVKIQLLDFRKRNTSGGSNKVRMRLAPFTIRLSDGTTITFTTPDC